MRERYFAEIPVDLGIEIADPGACLIRLEGRDPSAGFEGRDSCFDLSTGRGSNLNLPTTEEKFDRQAQHLGPIGIDADPAG